MTVTALAMLALLQASPIHPTAAQWGEHLLVADGDGTVRAWTSKTLAFDAARTKQLNGDGLLAIVANGDVLWGFDGTRAFTWDDAGARWDLVQSKPPRSACTAFAVVDGAPVGTCGPGVHRFTDGRYWEAPAYKDQIEGRGFGDAPKAIGSHGTQLAIGTGFGEWGGHLWLLDVATGQWAKYYDELGGAVGLAWTGAGWAVAWSMSHFTALARLRVHGADGKPLKQGKELRDKYLRKLAFDDEAKVLLGLEQNTLVRIDDDLRLTNVQDVGKVKYGPERHAVGVSPGIGALLALRSRGERGVVDPSLAGRVLVVPIAGEPLVVGAGKVTPLRTPAVDAGAPAKK
ncbi:MAG: hypothetical protein Q8L14_17635 [Myxococcales bacterium]|nr:hypothetical protein [Myxococcales bacterium]